MSCAPSVSQGCALVSLTTQRFTRFAEPFVPGKLKCGVWVCSLSPSCVTWDQREQEILAMLPSFVPQCPGSFVLGLLQFLCGSWQSSCPWLSCAGLSSCSVPVPQPIFPAMCQKVDQCQLLPLFTPAMGAAQSQKW